MSWSRVFGTAAKFLAVLVVVAVVAFLLLVGMVLAPFPTVLLAGASLSAYLGYRILALGWPGLRRGEMDLTTTRRIRGPSARLLGAAVCLLGLAVLAPAAMILRFLSTL